ncbi:MAG: Crp/Fnr family transcriptional regulator, partial [Chloroflexota bacterium]
RGVELNSETQAIKLGYLSQIDLFRDLNPNEIAKIEQATTMCSYDKGKVFYLPEETGEILFLIKQGRVHLYRLSPAGRKLTVATLGPGTFFGEMALVGQGMHNTFAEASEGCVLCLMNRNDVERFILGNPKIALRLVAALGQRLTEVENQIEALAFKSVPARLASLLLRLAREGEIEGPTHNDLAEMVGAYRETVTQVLDGFQSSGLLRLGRKSITILDKAGLKSIAESPQQPGR